MSRFIQLHTLTVYAPSNLNRDDTGRPKTAKFGGANRLRISSQALKRAIRTSDAFKSALEGHIGERTQRLGDELCAYLVSKGIAPDKAITEAGKIAAAFGKLKDSKDKNPTHIEQLAFVSPREKASAFKLADLVVEGGELPEKTEGIAKDLLGKADGAADIAMFGRMLASNPEFNREAAVQIAHAITTHKVDVEDDFYTAVDDLKKSDEDAGAGFIGELGFGSGVFYIYTCIDRDLLETNLGGDTELAKRTIAALIEGLATSSPSGKQASFASRSRASYIRVEKGNQQPRSLAAAFFKPARGEDLLTTSIVAIEATASAMNAAYGACHDAARTLDVTKGEGSLADITKFATE